MTTDTNPTPTEKPALDPSTRRYIEEYLKEVYTPAICDLVHGLITKSKEREARLDERIQHLEYWNELMGGALFDTIQEQVEHRRGLADAFDEIAKLAEQDDSPDTVAALRAVAEVFTKQKGHTEGIYAVVEAIEKHGTKVMLSTLQAAGEASPQQKADLDRLWAETVKGTDHGAN